MNLLKKRDFSSLIQFAGVFFVRGLGAISTLLLLLVIARRLTKEDAGLFSIGHAFVTMVAPISLFGLHIVGLRLISSRKLEKDAEEIRFIALRLVAIAGTMSMVLGGVVFGLASIIANSFYGKPDLEVVFRWVGPTIPLVAVGILISHQLQGVRKFSRALIVLSVSTPTIAAFVFWLSENVTLTDSLRIYAGSAIATFVLSFVFWPSVITCRSSSRVEMEGLAGRCSSVWVVNVMIQIVNWSGPLIAGIYVEASEIFALSASQRMANLVNFLLIGVNYVVTPRFARYWAEGEHDQMKRLALKSTRYMTLLATPLIIIICLFPTHIIGLFGKSFQSAAPLLIILSLSQYFNVMTGSVNGLLNMCGYERDLRNIALISGTFTILLSIVLTMHFGVIGTASATAIALVLQNCLAVYRVKKRLGFSMFSAFRLTRSD